MQCREKVCKNRDLSSKLTPRTDERAIFLAHLVAAKVWKHPKRFEDTRNSFSKFTYLISKTVPKKKREKRKIIGHFRRCSTINFIDFKIKKKGLGRKMVLITWSAAALCAE